MIIMDWIYVTVGFRFCHIINDGGDEDLSIMNKPKLNFHLVIYICSCTGVLRGMRTISRRRRRKLCIKKPPFPLKQGSSYRGAPGPGE